MEAFLKKESKVKSEKGEKLPGGEALLICQNPVLSD